MPLAIDTSVASAESATERPPSPRMAWLDALRGVAALVVAFHHSSYCFMPEFRKAMLDRFDAGTYGVMVFFLVSGYIIPASLERRGSVGSFWVGRLFRIYPLWAVASAVVLVLAVTGLTPLPAELRSQNPVMAVLGHLTMLQELLAMPNAINVIWTLSYEMVFYLLVVALFTVRLHRRSATIALGLAAVSVTLGGLVPPLFLSRMAGTDLVVVLAATALVLAIGCAMSSHPVLRSAGAVLGAVLAAVLVVTNGRIGLWHGLIIMAVMFTGTVIYRAEHGQISRWSAAITTAVVFACAVAGGIWHGGAETTPVAWSSAIAAAAISFALAMALRHRRLPRWLTGLGLISYSVYLLHPVLLKVTDGTIGRWRQDNLAMELSFLAVLLLLSWAAQRSVEAPGQRWGRHLARRMRETAG